VFPILYTGILLGFVIIVLGVSVIVELISSTRSPRSESEAYKPSPLPNVPAGWPVVARVENGLKANMVRNMLAGEGIEAVTEESHFARVHYAGNEPASMGVPIYVKPGEEQRAREFLQESNFAKHLV